jgi:hypothetical protein
MDLYTAVDRMLSCGHEDVDAALEDLARAFAEVEAAWTPPPSGTSASVLFAAVAGGIERAPVLAERLNMEVRTVSGHLIRLAAAGWFEVVGEKWKGGRRFVPTARTKVTVEGAMAGVRRMFKSAPRS